MIYLWIYLGGLVVAWWAINRFTKLDVFERGALVLFWPLFPALGITAILLWLFGAGWRDK
jgi:hypothetical protein